MSYCLVIVIVVIAGQKIVILGIVVKVVLIASRK